ncbi:MAG: SDR family oxidoreductase [Deltaproteobacteria bacterium]|nr:SDR family oxidoreductase [Deltaproteobacteria bacterium]MBW2220016.1 SDR family oxidoreductase [Deltaproteobacteria bacterium]
MNLLVLGANSDVAHAVSKKFAKEEKVNLYLASRNMEVLEKKAQDLQTRFGVNAKVLFFDAEDGQSRKDFYESLDPRPDGVILAFGYLGDQEKAQDSFEEAEKIINTNFTHAVAILEVIAKDFEKRGHGFIVGISSVAGERGRKSNYFYGAAKGALSIYLSGLRNRLSGRGINVITILPGFIDTKMTEGMDLPGALTASPDEVAEDIYVAFKKNKSIVYTKWFWKWVMAIIKSIPEPIFKRMSL